jgi:hypothetical protein
MKIEGETISNYFYYARWHFLILVLWTLVNFIFTYTFNPSFGEAMTKFAPVFLIVVFAHLGYQMAQKKKYNADSAIFNGAFVGFLTGFLAGVLGIGTASYEFIIFLRVGGWTFGPGMAGMIVGVVSFGLIIGFLRAILGAIIVWIGWTSTRKY